MQIYRWEPLTVCHHPGKSCKYKHCDSGDLVFLVWNVTLREHVFKGLCNLWVEVCHGESEPPNVWSTASGDTKYLICHMISQNHVIEQS